MGKGCWVAGRRGLWCRQKKVHPAFLGKDVPVRKKASPSQKSQAIATHAAPGVNGHGIHGIHGPQPNPPQKGVSVVHVL